MFRFGILTVFCLLLSQYPVFSADIVDDIHYTYDWGMDQLVINIRKEIPATERVLPGIKFRIEKEIEHDLPYILLKGIETLVIDSKTTGKLFMENHPSTINSIFELVSQLKCNSSLLTRDMKAISVTYTLELYPYIADLFIPHKRPTPIVPILGFVPSTDFTGIVIYVDNQLQMYGKEGKGNFTPSLFPRIFDEDHNLVIGVLRENPDIVRTSGAVGYQQLSDSPDLERIGQNPIKLKAREIFGINNTDIIISNRDAELILSRQNNIDLISQGRIVIIYNQVD